MVCTIRRHHVRRYPSRIGQDRPRVRPSKASFSPITLTRSGFLCISHCVAWGSRWGGYHLQLQTSVAVQSRDTCSHESCPRRSCSRLHRAATCHVRVGAAKVKYQMATSRVLVGAMSHKNRAFSIPQNAVRRRRWSVTSYPRCRPPLNGVRRSRLTCCRYSCTRCSVSRRRFR